MISTNLIFSFLLINLIIINPLNKQKMSFTLPELPYAVDALSPQIDSKTMEIHHGKHHAAYVNNLNAAIKGTEHEGKSIEALMGEISKHPAAVRNNGGGHFNHSLFWTILGPASDKTAPSKELESAIKDAFGSMDNFKEEFTKAATTRFGSGWAWLSVDKSGKLVVSSTPNQDNPLMDVAEVKGTPILGIDVWEHAYYLNYQNRRPDYITAFFEIINWNEVSKRFAAAK